MTTDRFTSGLWIAAALLCLFTTESAFAQGVISKGTTVSGRLERGDATLGSSGWVDHWCYRGTAGERITVTMTSPDLRYPRLAISRQDGSAPCGQGYVSYLARSEVDGRGVARLTWEIPESRSYVLRLMTGGAPFRDSGSYTLRLEDATNPPQGMGTPSSVASAPRTVQAREAQEIIDVAQRLFDAMRTRDTAALRSLFDSGVAITAVSKVGTASTVTDRVIVDEFIASIGRAGEELVERMWNPRVQVDGDIASLWARYDFHIGGRFSHCGSDAFHMV